MNTAAPPNRQPVRAPVGSPAARSTRETESPAGGQTTAERLGGGATTAETLAGADAATPERKPTSEILAEYQVADDTVAPWRPTFGPIRFVDVPGIDPKTLTSTEGRLLDDLGSRRGLLGLKSFADTAERAYVEADERFPQVDASGAEVVGGEDGHNDAFRHAFWNATMTREFGEDFAAAFGTAHEGLAGNPADREAMDLYNNELGRSVARANPDASTDELAELITRAVTDGEAVVIDGSGELAYGDEVAVGSTGEADDAPLATANRPPEGPGSL